MTRPGPILGQNWQEETARDNDPVRSRSLMITSGSSQSKYPHESENVVLVNGILRSPRVICHPPLSFYFCFFESALKASDCRTIARYAVSGGSTADRLKYAHEVNRAARINWTQINNGILWSYTLVVVRSDEGRRIGWCLRQRSTVVAAGV